jgi:hypothetical protein
LQLEVRERILCSDYYCVAHAVLEVASKMGIAHIEEVEDHARMFAELITDEGYFDDEYTFTALRELEVANYRINYKALPGRV